MADSPPPSITISQFIPILYIITDILNPVNGTEVVLYITMFFLVAIMAVLYYNNNIQYIVNKISRCLRNKKNSIANIYTVTGINGSNIPIFDITYDLNRKIFYTKSRLPGGNVENKWPMKIPTYDFVRKQTSGLMGIETVYSDKDYTSNRNVPFTYTGDGPLLDFIESNGGLTYMFN